MISSRHQDYLDTLPRDWQLVPMQLLGAIYSGGTPSRDISHFWNGTVAWVTPGEITALNGKYLTETREYISDAGFSSSSAQLMPVGSLLVTTRATIGLVAISQILVCTNQGFKSLALNSSSYADFYYYLLRFVSSEMIRLSSGSTFDEISKSDFSSIVVPRPRIDEQKQIASILDTVDEAIATTTAHIAKLKQAKAGLLHDLLTCGIDENGELRDPVRHPEQFKDSELGRIPKDWEIVKVAQVGDSKLGRQRAPQHQLGKHFVPYLRVANVLDGWIDYSDILEMNFTPQEQQVYKINNRDILLNEGQSLELTGRSAIYYDKSGQYCFQNTLIRFRCNSNSLPEYCQTVFKYWLDAGRFMRVARQTTSMAHLGCDRFAKMLFPLPILKEQEDIVKYLSKYESLIQTKKTQHQKLELLKQGLMSDLLTGKVRVTPTQEA
ncbi:MAG: restriction endonuclease subunit S [Cyanobacteria bacterium P01_A01_bin.135]